MARILKNPNQTNESQTYVDQNNVAVIVSKDGVYFSDDKEMDATVEYFKKVLGFVEVKKEKEVAKKSKATKEEVADN